MSCPLTVIFDIDETLVYYISNRLKPTSWDKLPETEKSKYTVIDAGSGIFLVRPHLDELFSFLLESGCKIGLWTWSDKGYAMGMRSAVLGKWKDNIQFVLHDEHAEASGELHGNSKDLNFLWYGPEKKDCLEECNTILIDDLPSNAANSSNIKNSITIEPFGPFGEVKDRSDPYKDCSKDTAFLECIEIIKRVLPKVKGCYDGGSGDNIFNEKNIAAAGLEGSVKNILLKKTGKVVKGIGAGKSHFFVAGRRHRTFKASRSRSRGNRRKPSTKGAYGRGRHTLRRSRVRT